MCDGDDTLAIKFHGMFLLIRTLNMSYFMRMYLLMGRISCSVPKIKHLSNLRQVIFGNTILNYDGSMSLA